VEIVECKIYKNPLVDGNTVCSVAIPLDFLQDKINLVKYIDLSVIGDGKKIESIMIKFKKAKE
jgi:hypothetical protein